MRLQEHKGNNKVRKENHPATFAYAVKDEPFSHMTPTMEEDLENSYKIIRDLYMGKGGSIREIDGEKWTLTLPGSCADIYRLQTGGLFLSRGGYVVGAASADEPITAVAVQEVGKPFSLVRAVYGTTGGAKELLNYTVLTEGTGKLEFAETINPTDFPGASEIKLFVLTSPFPNAAAFKAEARIEK